MESSKFDQSKPIGSYFADDKLYDTRAEMGNLKAISVIDNSFAGNEGLGEIIGELSTEDELRDALLRLKGELTELDTDKIKSDEFVVHDDTEMMILKSEVKDLNIDNIYFAFDSYLIDLKAKKILEDIVFHMKENSYWKIEIDTHTDSRGSAEYNQYLSEQRANSIRQFLIHEDINADRILSRAHGETDLIESCELDAPCDEDVHSINRRAEFRYMVVTSSSTTDNQ
jgi:outer membrane protein OmpA-like peptidoglycan-associated protein